MPNHFSLRQWNLVSVSSPIGTQITQAAGTARAAQIRGDKICTLGLLRRRRDLRGRLPLRA